jgi:hypothetical protein
LDATRPLGHKDIYREDRGETSLVSTSGFMLGVVGGLLDFGSATTMAINQGGSMMTWYMLSGYEWSALLVLLGITVVVVAVLSVTSTGVGHLKAFTASMVSLGVVMAILGTLMSGEPAVGTWAIYGYGMVIVGVLMAINGAMMLRTPMAV